VDGVYLGHPTYNIYRPDVAALFPNYANSNGAAAYFYLDTTAYKNGVHAIHWIAADNAGNADGIGSRFFTLQNTGNPSSDRLSANFKSQSESMKYSHLSQILKIPVNNSDPIKINVGYEGNSKSGTLYPDKRGIFTIAIRELERIEIKLPGSKDTEISGCTIIGNQLRFLPTGSTLDSKTRTFSWIPGPGFIGTYRIFFVETDQEGKITGKNIYITVGKNIGGNREVIAIPGKR
jgi:hypothetical protein